MKMLKAKKARKQYDNSFQEKHDRYMQEILHEIDKASRDGKLWVIFYLDNNPMLKEELVSMKGLTASDHLKKLGYSLSYHKEDNNDVVMVGW